MGATALVGPDIDNGVKLLKAIEANGIDVNLFMWAILEQYEDWRLFITSESFRDDDRVDAYSRISHAIHNLIPYSSPTITILKLKDPFVTELRGQFGHLSDTYGMRLGGQSFGGKYIEDAFVYRIR